MLVKKAKFGACSFRNTSIYVFCGITYNSTQESKDIKVNEELNSIERYDIGNDLWETITLNRGSLNACHNLGSVSCFGLHCMDEGMIIFGGEFPVPDQDGLTIVQDVFLFSPDHQRVKNLGKNSRVKWGPKLKDNSRYQNKEGLAIESI
jgi:hypothetical protein